MLDHQAFRTRPLHEAGADGGWPVLHAPVLDIGRPARDKLARSRRWTAVARFRRSIYLRGKDRDIVCLCGPSIGPGPLNVRCALPEQIDWPRLGIDPGAMAEVEGESLRVGKRVRFHLGRARIWEPVPVQGLCYAVSARLDLLLDAAANRAPDAGLGAVFRRERSRPTTNRAPASDGVLGVATPALLALARWLREACARRDLPALPPPEAVRLVGLGPGLTPSGDDYLGGLMIGLRAVNRSDLATALAQLILPVARRRTGAISHAHLACAAGGQGGAALHRIVAAIAGPGPLDIGSCLDAVARMGATSGWDALAGAVLPFRIHVGTRLPAWQFPVP